MRDGGAEPQGATPLDPDEAEGLIPIHIETRQELNEWEQANIARAEAWLTRRRLAQSVLTLEFLRELHRRMFDGTWAWAGHFRKTGKTIGVTPSQVPEQLVTLLENTKQQIQSGSLATDEIALRFHHLLVRIHPFSNGNGRHARAMTDALLAEVGSDRFSWGSASIDTAGTARTNYIAALRQADNGEYQSLRSFVRS